MWDYLYYKATKYYSKTESKLGFDDNKRRGSTVTGLFIGLNVQSIIMILYLYFEQINIFLKDFLGMIMVGIFLLILLLSVYVFEKKRHNFIFRKYSKESIKIKAGLILYILGSIGLFMLTVYVGSKRY